mgnify:CR=1 FL=1
MIHPLLSANEIKKFVEHVDSKAVITFDMLYPKLTEITWETSTKPVIVLARIADALPTYLNKVTINPNPNHNVILWNKFLKKGNQRKEPLPVDDGKGDDIAAILYSGGTTGIPKGVMIHNRAFNCMAVQAEEIKRDNTKDAAGKKALALMPVFHGFGLGITADRANRGLHTVLFAGSGCRVYPRGIGMRCLNFSCFGVRAGLTFSLFLYCACAFGGIIFPLTHIVRRFRFGYRLYFLFVGIKVFSANGALVVTEYAVLFAGGGSGDLAHMVMAQSGHFVPVLGIAAGAGVDRVALGGAGGF